MSTTKALEAAAVRAFNAGDRWHEYVSTHRDAIRRAEKRHSGTVQRLLALVTAGNLDGLEPLGVDAAWGEQWEKFLRPQSPA